MEHLKINRNGNSKAVNLPAQMCKRMGLKVGDYMSCWLTIKDEIIMIKGTEKGKPPWVKEK